MTQHISDDEARIKVRELIKDIGFVMLVTTDQEGSLSSRPMAVMAVEGDKVWFFTDANSPKTMEIGRDHEVLLACANPSGQAFVSVSGRARVLQDEAKQKELWSEGARLWFPKGHKSENLALIEVDMLGAEYWDSPGSKVLFAYGYVKALVAGKTPETGENAKVRFKGG
ncbi:pyridoxamine 5'-phosphate oxidase family protein [Roseococcus pinisoli]|uniref:Pyridoxamine 5'-phosphate oxidase family protein n=1 Tax=Roseococcus pinisoli TaxID=2835040 RepID=A0ABS5Q723_9PROT|nr:pyridoxamine 5'-phosphate oxidase family protein [Roseococcus pinisoli]MBS7809429.1 pyridoxamine 5'-phosphate oxidase family protein [Roseococcus pinisoli]